MTVPIHRVVLEGPDCSGKSTLFRKLHSVTGHRYNIHDRSTLSMLCYARLYGRSDVDKWRQLYANEVFDGNVFHVVVIPPEDVLLERLQKRGDEYQDAQSIVKLRSIFLEETYRTPNTLLVQSVQTKEETAMSVRAHIDEYENLDAETYGDLLIGWLTASRKREIQHRVTLEVPVGYSDRSCLDHAGEREYYASILQRIEEKIEAEFMGVNPLSMKQDPFTTRRFFVADDTCISSIHFLPRPSGCKVIVTLRSTHAVSNGGIDVRFLGHVASRFGSAWVDDPRRPISLELNFNSLHH